MFYHTTDEENAAIVVLTPSESKRLISKAVIAMPELSASLKNGRVVVIGGTTNAFIAEELIRRPLDRYWFAAGRTAFGELGANEEERRLPPVILIDGEESNIHLDDVLRDFTSDDVYIKGANAVDLDGNAGVLVASPVGGTIGTAIGILQARGSNLIIPVGLEKLVPSVAQAAAACGQGKFTKAMGLPVGMIPIVGAKVVTEIQAIEILFWEEDVVASHVASGGIAGSEGAVVIAVEGAKESVEKVFDYITTLKGEAPISPEVD
ncbi:MAG: hypothetical protein KAR06_03400 [Deltaproteobacteria bacterium]|nr:hypothetical protein [Deltaproteobacteria bacterium]